MFKKVFVFICFLMLIGCRAKEVPMAEQQPVDVVAVTLSEVAEMAHAELAMLAKLRGQGLEPLLPSPDPALNKIIAVSWTGPAEGILKEICLKLGYRYKEIGTPSGQPLIVVVHGLLCSAYSLLIDIAWQIQPRAIIQVNSIQKVIILSRTAGRR